MSYIEQLGKNAQKASKTLISLGSLEKNNLLRQVATALVEQAEMDFGRKCPRFGRCKRKRHFGHYARQAAFESRTHQGIAEGVGQVADLQDPIGRLSAAISIWTV